MRKEIENKNNLEQHHGYNEWYNQFNYKIQLRGCFKQGNLIGYIEDHMSEEETTFYIK
jgi:hypothetical protein